MTNNTIKLSDFIIDFLYKKGIKDIFLISGGGIIHIIDSIGKGKIRFICNHHEQACTMAAEAYSRITNNIGSCIVTSGPGGTNAITGVMGAWLDSIPMIVISGQIKKETIGAGKGVRQLGDQEINIIDIIKPITKYATTIIDPHEIQYHLEKAMMLAKNGRPGPVWLDIPLDIQSAYINKQKLIKFYPSELELDYNSNKKQIINSVEKVISKLKTARRPVLMVGNGVRLAHAQKHLLELIKILKIPVITSFAGFDLISSDNPYFAGRPGTIGQRNGNFVIQNSDLLLIIGSRLNIRMVGYNFDSFARSAYKIMVDIDKEEMNKKTIKIDLKLNFDARDFIRVLINRIRKQRLNLNTNDWINTINKWKQDYQTINSRYKMKKRYVSPYYFIYILSKYLDRKDILALANATSSICTYQGLKFPQGLRTITNSGCAAMGYGLPAAIGACIANKKQKVICLEGDGSIQMNIQELQTIVHYKLPIKIFVYNNGGYMSIRLTQTNLFGGKFIASNKNSGVSLPNIIKIAKAYGIKTERITNDYEVENKIKNILSTKGPIICEVILSHNQAFIPKAVSRKLSDGTIISLPLEDMYPFLKKEELKKIMFIPLWDEK